VIEKRQRVGLNRGDCGNGTCALPLATLSAIHLPNTAFNWEFRAARDLISLVDYGELMTAIRAGKQEE